MDRRCTHLYSEFVENALFVRLVAQQEALLDNALPGIILCNLPGMSKSFEMEIAEDTGIATGKMYGIYRSP